jgi:hypothetical protein
MMKIGAQLAAMVVQTSSNQSSLTPVVLSPSLRTFLALHPFCTGSRLSGLLNRLLAPDHLRFPADQVSGLRPPDGAVSPEVPEELPLADEPPAGRPVDGSGDAGAEEDSIADEIGGGDGGSLEDESEAAAIGVHEECYEELEVEGGWLHPLDAGQPPNDFIPPPPPSPPPMSLAAAAVDFGPCAAGGCRRAAVRLLLSAAAAACAGERLFRVSATLDSVSPELSSGDGGGAVLLRAWIATAAEVRCAAPAPAAPATAAAAAAVAMTAAAFNGTAASIHKQIQVK